jgi:hypothetical protein
MLLPRFCHVRSGPDVFLGEGDSGPFYFNALLGHYQQTDGGGMAAQREVRNAGFKDSRGFWMSCLALTDWKKQ